LIVGTGVADAPSENTGEKIAYTHLSVLAVLITIQDHQIHKYLNAKVSALPALRTDPYPTFHPKTNPSKVNPTKIQKS